MAGKNTAVFGIYATREAVEDTLVRLKEAGFRNEDVSVLLPENLGTKDLATQKSTKAPEGAAAGAGSGAVIGGALGWLVGVGSLAIPGLGPFIAAGPILAALAAQSVDLPARSWGWASRNTKQSATKDASRRVGF